MCAKVLLPLLLLTAVFFPSLGAGKGDRLDDLLQESAGERVGGYDVLNVESTLSQYPLGEIEGVWQMTGEGAVFAIVAERDSHLLRMIMVDSYDRSILPGTVIGVAAPSAKKGVYDARIFTVCSGGEMKTPKRFSLTLNDDNLMSIVPVKDGIKVSLYRLIPYMFRVGIRRVNDRPANLDGAIRLYPQTRPFTPVYL